MEEIIEDLEHMVKLLGDERLVPLKEKLIELHGSKREEREEKYLTRHSCMELVCSKELLDQGYDVDVEYSNSPFSKGLAIDVFGKKGSKTFGIEVESGSIPVEHSIDPLNYLRARIPSKIGRYSYRVDEFALAFPPFYTPPIPEFFLKPIEERKEEEMKNLEEICGRYYKTPPVSKDELLKGKLDYVWIIYVDVGNVLKLTPQKYLMYQPPYLYLIELLLEKRIE